MLTEKRKNTFIYRIRVFREKNASVFNSQLTYKPIKLKQIRNLGCLTIKSFDLTKAFDLYVKVVIGYFMIAGLIKIIRILIYEYPK